MQIERLIVKGKGPERAIIITKVKFSFEELHYLVSELTVLMVFQLCCPALQIGPCSRITDRSMQRNYRQVHAAELQIGPCSGVTDRSMQQNCRQVRAAELQIGPCSGVTARSVQRSYSQVRAAELQLGPCSRIQSPGKTLTGSNDFQQRC